MTYDHITHATDERLAEMIESFGFDIALSDPEKGAVLGEAARRLRRPKNCPFNSEQFE